MHIEFRMQHGKQMILLPDTRQEMEQLDKFFGKKYVPGEDSRRINAEYCIDDTFKPYIRFKK